MGYRDPLAETYADGTFEWLENSPKVLALSRKVGLDYGVIDYTVHDGELVVLDVNKTIGIGRLQDPSERSNYEQLLEHLAPGIYSQPAPTPTS
jgi:hypothetical protein